MARNTNNSIQASLEAVVPTFTPSFTINIAPFDGDSDKLEFFITQIKELTSLNRWTDAHALLYTKSKLTGPALCFITQRNEYQRITSLNDLISALRTQFKQQNLCKSITEFNSLSILPGESIRNLTHRLDSLAIKAHKSIRDQDALNSIKYNKFLSVIPNGYRRHILQNNILTYQEAVDKAILLQDCDISSEVLCATSAVSSPMQEIQTELKSLKESIQHFQTRSDNAHQSKPKFNSFNKFHRKPFFKHSQQSNYKSQPKSWHRKPPYSKYSQHNSQSSQSQNMPQVTSNFQQSSPIICQFCGQVGHGCRFCPSFRHNFIHVNNLPSASSNFVPQLTFPPPNVQSSTVSIAPVSEQTNSITNSSLNPQADTFYPNW